MFENISRLSEYLLIHVKQELYLPVTILFQYGCLPAWLYRYTTGGRLNVTNCLAPVRHRISPMRIVFELALK